MGSLEVLICAIHIWVKILLLSANLSPNKYHPLSAHQEWLKEINKNHPNVQLETIGKSFEGRDILLLKICNFKKCGQRPVYWIDAGIHAREWIGPAVLTFFVEVKIIICTNMIKYIKYLSSGIIDCLVQKLVSDTPQYKRLRREYDWYVLTIVNPDGYLETWLGDK